MYYMHNFGAHAKANTDSILSHFKKESWPNLVPFYSLIIIACKWSAIIENIFYQHEIQLFVIQWQFWHCKSFEPAFVT